MLLSTPKVALNILHFLLSAQISVFTFLGSKNAHDLILKGPCARFEVEPMSLTTVYENHKYVVKLKEKN